MPEENNLIFEDGDDLIPDLGDDACSGDDLISVLGDDASGGDDLISDLGYYVYGAGGICSS
jgi:hypothetical protein